MQRLLRPTILSLSLAVPTASQALGLGDIRVDSALHQPLVAQIELVGAADDELGRLSASIASDELFQHYNLERAPFIYGTTLSVGRDAQGRPVLNMRSTEKFTEPVVTLLVDLHTPHGELVREYTLFLDPAGLVDNGSVLSNANVAQDTASATSPAKPQRVEPSSSEAVPAAPTAPPSVSSKVLGKTYTVSRRDTLDHIVTAAGARSRIERHRMMIAIFRNNPAAFQNNFNRMHAGVTLTFPTAEQLAAISVEETHREYDAQMAAWRSSRSASNGTQSASAGLGAVNPGTSPAASETMPTDHAALKQRIASLEQSLAQIQQQLKQPLPAQTSAATPVTALAHHIASDVASGATAPASGGTASAPASGATVASAVRTALKDASAPTASTSAPRSAAVPNFQAAALAVASEGDSATTDEATSDDNEDETPAPQHRAVQLIATAISASLLFFAGAWFFLRRRSSYAYYTGPKHGTASAEPNSSDDEVAESDDTVELIKSATSLSQAPATASGATTASDVATTGASGIPGDSAAASASDIANALATTARAAREPKAAAKDPKSESSWFEDSFSTPIDDLLNDPTVSLAVDETARLPFDPAEPTVKLPATAADQAADTEVLVAPELQFAGDTVEQKFSFFNPEATTNTEHVVMGSALNEPKSFVERRKNPVDVLRQAIEREPDRSDLRLKLLELYYTAAAESRRAFLEATRQLTKNENLATPEDWSRIADMGRIIAPDDELFASEPAVDGKRVA